MLNHPPTDETATSKVNNVNAVINGSCSALSKASTQVVAQIIEGAAAELGLATDEVISRNWGGGVTEARYAAIRRLYWRTDLKIAQIADALGVTINTVHRALGFFVKLSFTPELSRARAVMAAPRVNAPTHEHHQSFQTKGD